MDAARWERLAVSTGFISVVLFIAGFFLPGAPLAADSATPKVQDYFVSKKTTLLVAYLCLLIGTAFFIWFVNALRGYMRRYEGGDGRLSNTLYAGGLVAMGVVIVTTALPAAVAYHIAEIGTPSTTQAFFDLANVGAVMTGPPAAVFLTAGSLIALRFKALPMWMAWLGIVGAVVNLVATCAIFSTSGLFSPTGPLAIVAFALVMVWVVSAAVTILARTSAPAPAAAG